MIIRGSVEIRAYNLLVLSSTALSSTFPRGKVSFWIKSFRIKLVSKFVGHAEGEHCPVVDEATYLLLGIKTYPFKYFSCSEMIVTVQLRSLFRFHFVCKCTR